MGGSTIVKVTVDVFEHVVETGAYSNSKVFKPITVSEELINILVEGAIKVPLEIVVPFNFQIKLSPT